MNYEVRIQSADGEEQIFAITGPEQEREMLESLLARLQHLTVQYQVLDHEFMSASQSERFKFYRGV